jgi:hypothetical protein
MRRTMLALMMIAPAMLALASMARSQEVAFAVPTPDDQSKVAVKESENSSSGVVTVANFQPVDVSESASDRPAPAARQHSPHPEPLMAPQADWSPSGMMWPGANFPYAAGPSAPPSLLRYMLCDPYSCPNIWQGYEAQRIADLAAKCTPPSGGCGCGHCGLCRGGRGYGQGIPCTTGDCFSASRPMNRYRMHGHAAASSSCSTCDGVVPSTAVAPSNDCPSCQAQQPSVPELSATPNTLNSKR